MGKATYKLSNWRVDSGKGPIGVPYRNKWIYAALKGPDLTDCTIDKVTIHFPQIRCTFDPAGELRVKYGGATLKRKVGTSNGAVEERSYNMNGAKDTMFKNGSGEVTLYAYHPYDEGYLAIDDANVTLEVEYTPKASRVEVPDTTVEAGNALAFTVKPYDTSYTHRVTLTMDTYSSTVTLDAGVTDGSIDAPLDWLHLITNTTVYTGGVLKVETLNGGEVIGSKSVTGISLLAPFYSLKVPYTMERMLTVDGVTYPDLGGNWVQGKCGMRISIPQVEAYYGARVTASIRIGEKYITGTPPLTLESGRILDSNVYVEINAVDTRGMKMLTRPQMLLIYPYEPPHATVEAWRVKADGTKDDFGTKGQYKCSYSHTEIGELNPAKVTLSVAGVSENTPPEEGWLLPSEFVTLDTGKAYTVVLTVQDAYETATASALIPSGMFLLHGNAQGNGAGIGHAATEQNALVVNPEWAVYMGGMDIVATINKLVADVAALQGN